MSVTLGRSVMRVALLATSLAVVTTPLLTPTPALAWWHHGWYGSPGWHGGWGWRAGYGEGWHRGWGYHRCCWGPPAFAARPPLVIGAPGVVVVP